LLRNRSKFTSFADPASQWIGARKGSVEPTPAFFAYSDNYLIDTKHGAIIDVEATRSIRSAEVKAQVSLRQLPLSQFHHFFSEGFCWGAVRRMSLATFSPWLFRVPGFCLIFTPWWLR
jgi:hypothetical protein